MLESGQQSRTPLRADLPCQSVPATVIKFSRLGGINHRNAFSPVLGWMSEIKVTAGPGIWEDAGEGEGSLSTNPVVPWLVTA